MERSIIVCCFLVLFAEPLYSCQCGGRPEPPESVKDAKLIFVGRVVDIDDEFSRLEQLWLKVRRWFDPLAVPPTHPSGKYCVYYGMKVTFQINEVWKGAAKSTVELHTGRSGGDCGYEFQEGKTYLVYVRENSWNGCDTDICTRTALVERATEDLVYLRSLRKRKAG